MNTGDITGFIAAIGGTAAAALSFPVFQNQMIAVFGATLAKRTSGHTNCRWTVVSTERLMLAHQR
jgi:hypothetical protein